MGLGVAIFAVIAFIVMVSKCSSSPDAAGTASANLMETNISAGVAAQEPPAVEPLNKSSITRGIAHFKLAYGAEAFPGAMIYSQNCYDALTHKFSWAKLDLCGAFDMLAARAMLDADTTGLDSEAAYFQSETSAGRYLAAATGGGEQASEADNRLSVLQARTAGVSLPTAEKKADASSYENDPIVVPNSQDSPVSENSEDLSELNDSGE